MSLQIRRGTDAQRQTVVFDLGEIVYTTDSKKLYIGDGSTAGGVNVLSTAAGTGLSWNSTTQTLNFAGTLSGYTTDNLAQGTVNLYYNSTKAKNDVATMFTAKGSPTVTGNVTATTTSTISFIGTLSTINGIGILTYVSGTVPQIGMVLVGTGITTGTYIVSGTQSSGFILSAAPTAGTSIAITGTISFVTLGSNTGLVALTPIIVTGVGGGGLSAGTYYIINPTAGTNQITVATSLANAENGIAITNLTVASLSSTTFSAGGPDSNITFVYNASTGTMSVNSAASGLTAILQDTTPTLGGNLVLNNNNITGTGSINITGNLSASGTLGVSGTTTLGTTNITTGTITTLNTSTINAPDAGNGMTLAAKLGNSLSVGYYNGTLAAPTPVSVNTGGMVISIKGYIGANTYGFSGAIGTIWDSTANISDPYPKSSIALISGGGGSVANYAIFNSAGIFNSAVLQTTVYSVAGTALPSAATSGVGARAFVSDATATTYASTYTGGGSNKVPVYSDGSVWRIG